MADWNYQDRRLAGKVIRSAFENVTDSIIDPHSAIKVLTVTVTAELGAFAMIYVSKDKVQEFIADSDDNVWMYGSVAVFLVGFLTAFATYRLVADKWPHKHSHFITWFVSISSGILNVLLFFALLTLEPR